MVISKILFDSGFRRTSLRGRSDFSVALGHSDISRDGCVGNPKVPFTNQKGEVEVEGFTSAAASILRCHAARMSIHLSYHEDHNSL